jgi:hypothetical protein
MIWLIVLLLLLCFIPRNKIEVKEYYGNGKIVMYSTDSLLESYGKYTIPWNQKYAETHGYDFILDQQPTTLSSPAWEKVRVMKEALNNCPWVLYVDVDAIFNNPMVTIEKAIASRGNQDVMVCSDGPNSNNLYVANGGVIFVRNSPGGHYFLDKLWSMRYEYTEFAFEQKAMSDLLRSDDANFVALVCDSREFNSDYLTVKVIENTGQWPSDFIVHLMATSNEVRINLFRLRIQELSNR